MKKIKNTPKKAVPPSATSVRLEKIRKLLGEAHSLAAEDEKIGFFGFFTYAGTLNGSESISPHDRAAGLLGVIPREPISHALVKARL